jgi:hypothetical protein
LKRHSTILAGKSEKGGYFTLGITGCSLLLDNRVRSQAGGGSSSNQFNFLGQFDSTRDGKCVQE